MTHRPLQYMCQRHDLRRGWCVISPLFLSKSRLSRDHIPATFCYTKEKRRWHHARQSHPIHWQSDHRQQTHTKTTTHPPLRMRPGRPHPHAHPRSPVLLRSHLRLALSRHAAAYMSTYIEGKITNWIIKGNASLSREVPSLRGGGFRETRRFLFFVGATVPVALIFMLKCRISCDHIFCLNWYTTYIHIVAN